MKQKKFDAAIYFKLKRSDLENIRSLASMVDLSINEVCRRSLRIGSAVLKSEGVLGGSKNQEANKTVG